MSRNKGFTLLELLVVIVIIGLLAGYVAPRYFGQVGKSEVQVAKAQIESIEKALDQFRLDTRSYPSAETAYLIGYHSPLIYGSNNLEHRYDDVLSGRAEMRHGEGLRERLTAGPGDSVYIPAGVPHRPANLSDTEPVRAVIARTDPNEQESVVLLDDDHQVVARH